MSTGGSKAAAIADEHVSSEAVAEHPDATGHVVPDHAIALPTNT